MVTINTRPQVVLPTKFSGKESKTKLYVFVVVYKMYINYTKRLVFKFQASDNNFKMFWKTF